MDPDVIKWIVKNRLDMGEPSRQLFIKELRDNPQEAKAFIKSKLDEWTLIAVFMTGKANVICDFDEAAGQLLQAAKKHYAAELAATV